MKNFLRKNKLALWLCAIFISVFFGLTFLGLNAQEQLAISSHKESLQLLANEKAMLVNSVLEAQEDKLFIIASMNVFKEAVLFPDDTAKMEIAKDRINELGDIIPDISLLTNEGVVLAGDIDLSEIVIGGQSYFALKEKRVLIEHYYCEHKKNHFYAVFGPIYDKIEQDKVIGVIAFDVELDKIGALMKETIESETNEVYLTDRKGLLLSDSEYIGQGNKKGVLIQEVKSEGVEECQEDLKKYHKDGAVEEHEEEIPKYFNYMGDEVFGAHAYVPTTMGCVIAEEAADEVVRFSLIDYIVNMLKY